MFICWSFEKKTNPKYVWSASINDLHCSVAYLITSAKNSCLASQTQTDGTHNAGLSSTIGPDNHVQIRSRMHHRVVVRSVSTR